MSRNSGMLRGRKRILKVDLDVAAAERSAAGDVIRGSGLMSGGAFDEQTGLKSVRIGVNELVCGRIHAGRVGVSGAVRLRRAGAPAPQITQRAPRHPQQKQVEDGKEAELQPDRDWLERVIGLLQLERHRRRAELDLVPRLEHLGAVGAAAVDR